MKLPTIGVLSAGFLLAGCSLLKDDPDAQVAYSDPLDESWYAEPASDPASRAAIADTAPLTSRSATAGSVARGNDTGPASVQDPDWEFSSDSASGSDSSRQATSFEDVDSTSAITGAPVGGPLVAESGPEPEDSALVATRYPIGADAGDPLSNPSPPGRFDETGLRLNVTPPPALGGGSRDPNSLMAPFPPPRFGSSASRGVDPTNPSATWGSSSVPPPRTPDSTLRYGPTTMSPRSSPPPRTTRDPMSVRVPPEQPEPNLSSPSSRESTQGPVPDADKLKEAAVAQYKLGNFPEATRMFRQFQRVYPDETTDWVQWHLSQSLLQEGRWGEAGDEFLKLVGSRNRELRAEALLKLGIIEAKRGNFDLAKNRWDRILEEYPDTKAVERAAQELSRNQP